MKMKNCKKKTKKLIKITLHSKNLLKNYKMNLKFYPRKQKGINSYF